jgi:nitroreductase
VQNQINEIIAQRRSIYPKEFTGEKIDQTVLETLLQNANFAPNHKSNYPWRFIVIKDHSLENWVNKAAEIYQTETAVESFNQAKFDKIKQYALQVSHAVAIVMERESDTKSIEREDLCAVAAAVQNMYLSLSQFEQVGGYWSTGMGTYSKAMFDYLKLNENQTLLGFFVLGHVENKRTEGHKKDYTKFVSYL